MKKTRKKKTIKKNESTSAINLSDKSITGSLKL